jgi:hypothetical protein
MEDTDISSHRGNTTDDVPAATRHTTIERDGKDTDFNYVISSDDTTAIPKGTLDPVYEAKARVLNHAVRARENACW